MSTSPVNPGLVTVPTPIPQPATADYGFSALDLYPSYDRASYQAAAGVAPADYDSTQPTKDWAATVDPSGNPITPETPSVTFGCYVQVGNTEPAWGSFTLTGAQALGFNIPGIQTFPAYVIAPTPATQGGDVGSANSINPGELSTMAQALALAESWGMTAAQAQAAVADTYNRQFAPFTINYNGETRQWLTIDWNNTLIDVGEMLQQMYANGVGAPGSWTLTGPAPVWVSAQPAQAPVPNAAGPIPQRQLNTFGATNESFSVGLMGVSVMNGNVPSAATETGGGLTAAQIAQLQQLLDAVNTLLGVLGQPAAS